MIKNRHFCTGTESKPLKIYLVRHAIAEPLATGKYKTDAERPLTEAGFAQAQMVANALKAVGARLKLVISSPYLRAEQTAKVFADNFNCELIKSAKLSPGVAVKSFIESLEAYQSKDELMLVGHEPDMGELVSVLVGGSPVFRMPFRKSAVCLVNCEEVPPALSGNLEWILTPDLISGLVQASV